MSEDKRSWIMRNKSMFSWAELAEELKVNKNTLRAIIYNKRNLRNADKLILAAEKYIKEKAKNVLV